MNIAAIVSKLDEEIARLEQVKALLMAESGSGKARKPGRQPAAATRTKKARVLSPEARARIAAAQKKRWAKAKKASKAS